MCVFPKLKCLIYILPITYQLHGHKVYILSFPPAIESIRTCIRFYFIRRFYKYIFSIYFFRSYVPYTGEFTKRVREMSSQLFFTLYTLSEYSSAHKQLRRFIPNTFHESLIGFCETHFVFLYLFLES